MIINPQVPLHRLVLSLSEALDNFHPSIVDHQQRVAYIATEIARRLGYERKDQISLFHAAALHDIGLIGGENRIRTIALRQLESTLWHSEVGWALLTGNPLFEGAAEIVRHHHIRWDARDAAEQNGLPVPLSSHVLSLADEVERMIDRRADVLMQVPSISARMAEEAGKAFHPGAAEALRELGRSEAFWLDAVSPRIYSVLLRQIDWPTLVIDETAIRPVAELFGRIVDAASRWTMVHSAGVAAAATALAERMDFSPRELGLMRAAGYLHDLGKLTVPTHILDKAGKLDAQELAVVRGHTYHTFRILDSIGGMPQISEWAAFHHERLNGTGYPFRHGAKDLTLGSRIMAVADILTAVTEERPYRKAMAREQSLKVLDDGVRERALDGEVVEVVRRDYEKIGATRQSEQADYRQKQEGLTALMRVPQGIA